MPIASFKNKVFQVSSNRKYTFDNLEWIPGELDTESQEKLQDKPSTYIKGQTLGTITFDIPLSANFGVNVRKEIEEWESIKSSSKPDIFILGQKPLSKNKWLLKSVGVTDPLIDANGNLLKATLRLSFEEYVRAGSAAASKNASAGATGGLNMAPSDYIYNPPDKADQKRDNPNRAQAMQIALQERRLMDGVI